MAFGDATRQSLLLATEDLLVQSGLEALSMRAVTQAAGSNLAAVNYHFGTKLGLVREVIRRRLRDLDEQGVGELQSLGEPVGTQGVAEAFVRVLFSGPERARPLALVGRGLVAADPRLRHLVAAEAAPLLGRFERLLMAAGPGRDRASVHFALVSCLAAAALFAIDSEVPGRLGDGRFRFDRPGELAARLGRQLVAALD